MKLHIKMFAFLCLFLAITCQAKTIYVNDDGPADFNNIQAAIDDCNDGDVIVAEGTYYENINFKGKNIILRSTDPNNSYIVAETIIDGSLRGSVVTFAGTESPTCMLSGFTITNGSGTFYGGGIRGNGTLATIQNNIITKNVADVPMFPSSGRGGGLYDCDGIIQYNTISENSSWCNEGGAAGGGLYGCDGTIRNNIISGNSARGLGNCRGGGLSNCNGTIQNNLILGNYASGYGTRSKGGGLSNCNGTIQNNTICDNYADEHSGFLDYGGGLSDCNGLIRNCIIWKNTADEGAQLYASSTPAYCCIQNWSGDGSGNISVDPLFADPVINDLHLKSQAGRWDASEGRWTKDEVTSLCIDAGNLSSPIGLEPFPNGGIINMGSFGGTAEASKSYFGKPPCETIVAGDVNGDCIVNLVDFALIAFHWLEEH
jgi:hypothetical protein